MAEMASSLRRRALQGVILLLVFYPVGVYVYTESVNQATTEDMILKNIESAIRYCFEVKAAMEALFARPKEQPFGNLTPLDKLFEEPARFERNLLRVLHTGGGAVSQIRFTSVYDGDKRILQWGQDGPAQEAGEIHVNYPIDYEALRKRVYELASRNPSAGICRISMPLELGGDRPARLVVGLVPPEASSQLVQLSERLNMRALRLSLIGTSLLALLAAYIVYLNDRTRELQLKLEQEKRLAYVGTIAAGMAHEIRNPLSSVKMNIQMIEDRLSNSGRQDSDYLVNKIARIRRETARLEESESNFLAFARPRPLKRQWTDLNQAVDHIIEFVEPVCLNDGHRIVRDYAPGLPQAYIDSDQVGQAVENLLRNADQAIGTGGVIEVRTGRKGSDLEIQVSDNGPGVPPEARDKLFDIFFTTKPGGTGLGLTIVKQIAEAHGGSVSFQTAQGNGTTFTVHLPLTGGDGP